MLELAARAHLAGIDGLALLGERDLVRAEIGQLVVVRADEIRREDMRDLARMIVAELGAALGRGRKRGSRG